MIGCIVGGVVALFAAFCGIWCCRRRRRRRAINRSDRSLLAAPSQGYYPTVKPPAYESPKLAADGSRQMLKTKNDPLRSVPGRESLPNKPAWDARYDQEVELDQLKPVTPPNPPFPTQQTVHSAPGSVTRRYSPTQNPPETPAYYYVPFPAPILAEVRDYHPNSPIPPPRSYSPLSPSISTRYTTSPFDDPPSRQSSSFSSAASMRTMSYVPAHPPYAAYSPYATYSPYAITSPTPPLLDGPKSPYRAYSPRLHARYEHMAQSPPLATVDPSSEHAPRKSSPLNHEPLELSTPYNTRPQSMSLDAPPRQEQHNPARRTAWEPPNEQQGRLSYDVLQQQPTNPATSLLPQQPRTDILKTANHPQELSSGHSIRRPALQLGTPSWMVPR